MHGSRVALRERVGWLSTARGGGNARPARTADHHVLVLGKSGERDSDVVARLGRAFEA